VDLAAAITPAITQPTDVAALFAARCAQVPGALVAFALDRPQAQPLKVARREFVEGQGVGCAGERIGNVLSRKKSVND